MADGSISNSSSNGSGNAQEKDSSNDGVDTMSSTTATKYSSTSSTKCRCINPMKAKMGLFRGWKKAHEANINMVYEYNHSQNGNNNNNNKALDVVFLGDSIVEEWNGRWMGKEQETWKGIHEEWKKLFDPSVTLGALNGLALGIAGDNIANLLWRIRNGELEHINSKVFWLLIGTNDLSLGCSDKTILLGILHVVEEIRKQKPDSIIVLNGILPRTNDKEGRLVTRNGNVVDHHDGDDEDEDVHTQTMTKGMSLNTSSSTNQRRISQWQSIQSINKSLAKFAQQHDRIEYFDASDIFIARMGTKVYQRDELFLMKELQGDFLHPTALGHKFWGEAIVDYIASDLDTPENLRRRQGRNRR
jgi:Lysophospholipase L1 and related esterases